MSGLPGLERPGYVPASATTIKEALDEAGRLGRRRVRGLSAEDLDAAIDEAEAERVTWATVATEWGDWLDRLRDERSRQEAQR